MLLLFGIFPGGLLEISRASTEDLKPPIQFTLDDANGAEPETVSTDAPGG